MPKPTSDPHESARRAYSSAAELAKTLDGEDRYHLRSIVDHMMELELELQEQRQVGAKMALSIVERGLRSRRSGLRAREAAHG